MTIRDASDLNAYKEEINPELFNNPLFSQAIAHAFGCTKDLMGNKGYDPIDLRISSDGKTVYLHDVKETPITAKPTSNYNQIFGITININDNGSFEVTEKYGSLTKREDVLALHDDSSSIRQLFLKDPKEKFLLSTYYTHRVFDKNGIEMEISTYDDDYPFEALTGDANTTLVSQVLSDMHCPTKWNHEFAPDPAMFSYDATATHTFRKASNLGLIETDTIKGIKGHYGSMSHGKLTDGGLYFTNTEYLERLRYCGTPAMDFKEDLNVAKSGPYAGMTRDQINWEAYDSYCRRIESSKTSKDDPLYTAVVGYNKESYMNPEKYAPSQK